MDKLRFNTRYGYVTATERRHIRSLIDQGLSEGGTARKYYKVVDSGPDWLAVQVSTHERDDWGRPQTRKSMVTVMGVERPVPVVVSDVVITQGAA